MNAASGDEPTRRPMTAKERLLQEAPDWTEEQARHALAAATGRIIDDWGDLGELTDALTARGPRRPCRGRAHSRLRAMAPVSPARGEVWWYDEPGKEPRPFVILTRPEAIAVLDKLVGVPSTQTIRGIQTGTRSAPRSPEA